MCLGALVDAGTPLKKIEEGLKALPIKGYRLEAKKVKRAGISATKVDVIIINRKSAVHIHKTWKDIERVVKTSTLPDRIKQGGLRIFRRLFESEGKVHGEPYNSTHLHELGAIDCIVDIFGTLVGLDHLEVNKIYSSTVNLGSGSIETEHGKLPVPAPATVEILRGIPVYSSDIPFELTTPTGAAILREIVSVFKTMPPMNIKKIGYGAGQKDIKGFPNSLRIFLGEDTSPYNLKDFKNPPQSTLAKSGFRGFKNLPKVTVIETNIDDMNPQLYEYVMERIFKAGALDVYLMQVIMKKGRPGVVLTVLCPENRKADIIGILFKETTTIGVRFFESSRIVLEREIKEVKMGFGKIRVKSSRVDDATVRLSPEYEDCKRVAKKYKMPLQEIIERVANLKEGTK
ncbi:MAG: nickel pincer cofactor biosynthesis protein LarC [Thermodesulfovibrionales bacterium]